MPCLEARVLYNVLAAMTCFHGHKGGACSKPELYSSAMCCAFAITLKIPSEKWSRLWDRGVAIRAGLEAAKASISQQQDMEKHERAATHDMLQALSARARETEEKALLQHEGAMAAMLANQQIQVDIITSVQLCQLTWSLRMFDIDSGFVKACLPLEIHLYRGMTLEDHLLEWRE